MTGKGYGIEKVILHPNYDDSNGPVNDVALLKLSSPVNIPNSQLAILPSKKVEQTLAPISTCSEVAGWGLQNSGDSKVSRFLNSVNVRQLNTSLCKKAYGNIRSGPHLCAGFEQGGKDSCQGDSGGP